MYRLQKLWRPAIYQGAGRKDDYFEGWYFKLVDRKLENAFAVIPGISLKGPEDDSHSFIQLLEGSSASSSYFRFPLDDFDYTNRRFSLKIGRNLFSSEGLFLDIDRDDSRVKADITFNDPVPWPGSMFSPGAMGWYSFVPLMECYHGVVSMDHGLKGWIDVNGRSTGLDGGRGYIEKDWGRSFPEGWIWLQSNNFRDCSRCSIMLSIARIPWRGRKFTGFICGFLNGEDLNIFATYNRAVIKKLGYSPGHDKAHVCIMRKDLELEISAAGQSSAGLASPVMGAMEGRINESMDAEIRVRLWRSGELVVDDTAQRGGLEIIDPEVLGGDPGQQQDRTVKTAIRKGGRR